MRIHKKTILITIDNLLDINKVEEFVGYEIYANKEFILEKFNPKGEFEQITGEENIFSESVAIRPETIAISREKKDADNLETGIANVGFKIYDIIFSTNFKTPIKKNRNLPIKKVRN